MTRDAATIRRTAARLGLIVLALGLWSTGATADWPRLLLDESGGALQPGSNGDLAFDGAGTAWVAHIDQDTLELVVQWGSWVDGEPGTWDFTVDHRVPEISIQLSLDIATCGDEVAVSALDGRCDARLFWRQSDGVWTERTFAGSECPNTSVAWNPLDCSAGPAMVFRSSGQGKKRHWNQLWFATWDGEPVLVEEARGWNYEITALAYDSTGRPAILHSRDDNKMVSLAFQDPAGGPWRSEPVYPRSDPPPDPPDIVHPTGGYGLAFDDGVPMAVFEAWGLDYPPIKVCRRGAALELDSSPVRWTCEEVPGTIFHSPASGRGNLRLDAFGDPLVGSSQADWKTGSGSVRITTRCPGSPWTDSALLGFGEIVFEVEQQPWPELTGLAVDPITQQPAVLFWQNDPVNEYDRLWFGWRESSLPLEPLGLQEGGILCGDGADNDCDASADDLDVGCSGIDCSALTEICDDADNNDCDARIDCDDADCAASCDALCLPKRDPCTSDEECCSGRCRKGTCR
jgi:hypothetical protein